MKRNETKKTLLNLGYDEITSDLILDDIKYYLRANKQGLKDITAIKYYNQDHCILEVNNQIVGII